MTLQDILVACTGNDIIVGNTLYCRGAAQTSVVKKLSGYEKHIFLESLEWKLVNSSSQGPEEYVLLYEIP